MVLSLPLVLALVGSATGLIIGMLIFGEVSDALVCPTAGSGGGGGESILFDTLAESSDSTINGGATNTWIGQLVSTTGQQITSVTVNGINTFGETTGTIESQIWVGAITDIDTSTLVAESDNTEQLAGGNNVNFTFLFSPPVAVNDPDTFVALHMENWDSEAEFLSSTSDISSGNLWMHLEDPESGFFQQFGIEDMLMKVTIGEGGSEGETGAEQCLQAKDTAWTVIAILPVALFFGLFAIFSSLGVTRPT